MAGFAGVGGVHPVDRLTFCPSDEDSATGEPSPFANFPIAACAFFCE